VEKVFFSDVLTVINGKNQSKVENPNGKYPIYGSGGIIGYADDFICQANTVIIGRKGNINKPIFVKTPFWNVDTAFGLSVKTEVLLPKYLFYFCEKFDFEKLNTTVTIPSLTKANILKIEIKIPEKKEQIKIIEVLDKVTTLIEKRKEQLSKLDELVKARFVELFGEVENLIHSWDVKRFAEVTINFDSTRKPVKDADRQKMQGQYPYYGATGIVDHVNDYRIDGTFLLISEDGKALEFRNKDIAFIASGKIWVNNHAHVLQCTEDIEMIFLMYYMNFRNISDWVTGIDQKKLNRANMDKIPIGLPPIELQKQFAAFVEQTDKSKFEVQKSLEKLELLKKALMQKYFG